MPKGACRNLVRALAWTYFVSWAMFPILFILGREAFGHISYYGSNIGHYILEIFSKNVWTMLGHTLRYKVGRCVQCGIVGHGAGPRTQSQPPHRACKWVSPRPSSTSCTGASFCPPCTPSLRPPCVCHADPPTHHHPRQPDQEGSDQRGGRVHGCGGVCGLR